MLLNLHVKNLALIEEVDIDFSRGLVVLTGETGAGKSLILGSVNIALGNKVTKEIIRNGKDFALVELTFSVDDITKKKLEENDINLEDDVVVVSRKITEGRSVSKINGETVSLSTLKSIMSSLIDIYGQHDHQSLLYKSKHLEILDKFSGCNNSELKNNLSEKYKKYVLLKERILEFDKDENSRMRELEFAKYEVNEIDEADLLNHEDEILEDEYRKTSNSQTLIDNFNNISYILDDNQGIKNLISNCISLINEVDIEDTAISNIRDEIYNLEALTQDISREVHDYAESINTDPMRLNEIEKRLDLINHLKLKYGKSIEDVLAYRDEKQKQLDDLLNYEENFNKAKVELDNTEKEILVLCEELSKIRQNAAKDLEERIVKALEDLNFLQTKFEIKITRKDDFNEKGFDDVEFLISTNPGEPVRSLGKVASGGELSRIMLAIKSILANEEDVDTLIFDEIDTGISGITAGKVAGKLATISRKCQVICISHLAQIASMADSHYLIEKSINDNETFTKIQKLDYDSSINELVRISGAGQITEIAKQHAIELKEMADREKISQS